MANCQAHSSNINHIGGSTRTNVTATPTTPANSASLPRRRPKPARRGTADDGEASAGGAPMVEIFGGIFALLLVLFLLMNLVSTAALVERLEAASDEGLYRVGWGQSGAGFVVLSFPGEVRVVETGETVRRGEICAPASPFVAYARRVYQADDQQLIFAILEGGVATMAEARACMMRLMPNRTLSIGWIIANNELLKSVSLGDIPAYVKQAVAEPATPRDGRTAGDDPP